MTRNQLDYARMLETERSNRVQETLTRERDEKNYAAAMAQLDEQVRANKAREQLDLARNVEQQRSNLAAEQISRDRLIEEGRRNREVESQGRASLSLMAARDDETRRSNIARERETSRANLARESELYRSNIANEALQGQRIGLGYAQLAEARRLNTANISLGVQRLNQDRELSVSQLIEQRRANITRENETRRANLAHEFELNRSNVAREDENLRSNQARELEAQRHNQAVELITGVSTFGGLARDLSSSYLNLKNATSRRNLRYGRSKKEEETWW